MTEAEWLVATEPESMVQALRSVVGSWRKFRLFAVACCKRMVQTVPVPEGSLRAVELAERYADGNTSSLAVHVPWEPCSSAAWHACLNCLETDDPVELADCASGNSSWAVAESGQVPPHHNARGPVFKARLAAEQTVQASLVCCIFGNPFRPVAFAPSWRSETAVSLAAGIYEERTFDRLPILADALEEAGCDNADVLNHLRGPGPHARGCWVVDGVLGKE